ncbi:hypothetical protein GCM10027075_22480 [Streptomyces heilongjiangensis]
MPRAAVNIYRFLVDEIREWTRPDESERAAGKAGRKLLIKSDSPKGSRKANK